MASINELSRCNVCNNISPVAKLDGIFVRGKYICADCETQLVRSKATDEKYQQYIQVIKKMWFQEKV